MDAKPRARPRSDCGADRRPLSRQQTHSSRIQPDLAATEGSARRTALRSGSRRRRAAHAPRRRQLQEQPMTARDLPIELKREAALERIRRGKELMTKASRALLDRHPMAVALGDAAKAEMDDARAELAALDAQAGE